MRLKRVFKNVDVVDVNEKRLRRNMAVCVENGVITDLIEAKNMVPSYETEEVVDLSGKTMIPGLINCHVHTLSNPMGFNDPVETRESKLLLRGMENNKMHLRSGFVFLRDMGGRAYVDVELRNGIKEKLIRGCDMYVSGRALTITGGHGSINGIECDGADAFVKGVRENAKNGADLIKLMVTGGVLSPNTDPERCPVSFDELKAAVETAHSLGKKTAAHVHSTKGIKAAIKAGIDSIEHGVFMDDEAAGMLGESDAYYVPTLVAPYFIVKNAELGNIPVFMVEKAKRMIEVHFESFRKALRSGVRIAMGTDSGTPFNLHDESLFELKLMTEAGMSNMDALVAATKTAAELIGISMSLGSITVGKKASFVVLDGNPAEDLKVLSGEKCIYKDGVRII